MINSDRPVVTEHPFWEIEEVENVEEEETAPRMVSRDPGSFSNQGLEEHLVDHIPYRSWCHYCASSRMSCHRKAKEGCLVAGWHQGDPQKGCLVAGALGNPATRICGLLLACRWEIHHYFFVQIWTSAPTDKHLNFKLKNR